MAETEILIFILDIFIILLGIVSFSIPICAFVSLILVLGVVVYVPSLISDAFLLQFTIISMAINVGIVLMALFRKLTD